MNDSACVEDLFRATHVFQDLSRTVLRSSTQFLSAQMGERLSPGL
jgi:hypothetical protein